MGSDVPVQWLARHFAILHALDEELLKTRMADEIAPIALAHLGELVAWDRASVLIFDEPAGEAVFLESGERGAGELAGAGRLPLAEFRQLGRFRAGELRTVEDVATLPEPGPIDRRLRALGIRAYANVPLMARGELLGLLNVARKRAGAFAPEEVELIRAVAGRLAAALWQNQLFERLQQHARLLEEQVSERTETLRHQRDFLDAVFDTAGALIVVLDREGRVVRLNRTAEEAIGLTTALARERPIWEVLSLEIELTGSLLKAMRMGAFPEEFESILCTQGGERRFVEWSNTILVDVRGRVEYIVAVGMDSTERQRAEEAYERLVEESLQGLLILQDYRVVFANPAFAAITGYGADTFYRLEWPAVLANIHPRDRASFQERFASLFRGEAPTPRFEFRFLRADGEWRWVESYLRPIEYDGAPAVQATCVDNTERRQMQEASRRLAAIVNSSDDAIIGKTLSGTITNWNRGATRIYGYSEAEARGRHVSFLAPTDRQREPAELLGRLQAGERIEQYETIRRHRDGRMIAVSLTLSPIVDEGGDVVGVATIARDVTARKAAEAALRESEAFNQAILDSLPVHIAVLNAQGQMEAVNQSWSDFAAETKGEYLACTGVETHDLQICRCAVGEEKEQALRVLDGVRGVIDGESAHFAHEYACYLAGGERWFLMNVTPLGNGQGGAVVSHIDITERRKAESQIRYQAHLLENVQDAVISTDREWRIQSWNQAAEQLYGWRAEEVLGRPAQAIVQTDYRPGQREEVIEQVLSEGHWEGQVIQKGKDGGDLCIYASVSSLFNQAGAQVGAVAVNRDIGERLRIQQERENLFKEVNRQRQQLRTLSEQLRQLTRQVVDSHEEERYRLSRELHDEAGQALSVLRYNLELFRRDLLSGPNVGLNPKEADVRLEGALTICDQTLQQIRTMAHDLRPGSLEDLGLNMALEAYCHDFAERTRLQITYEGLEVPPVSQAVAISLYRILQEALTNVLKHARAQQVQVVLSQTERTLSLTVQDDGEGFSREQDQVGGDGGDGIGLLGMKERLEAINGSLELDSWPGEGTRLVARVPCTCREPAAADEEVVYENDTRIAG